MQQQAATLLEKIAAKLRRIGVSNLISNGSFFRPLLCVFAACLYMQASVTLDATQVTHEGIKYAASPDHGYYHASKGILDYFHLRLNSNSSDVPKGVFYLKVTAVPSEGSMATRELTIMFRVLNGLLSSSDGGIPWSPSVLIQGRRTSTYSRTTNDATIDKWTWTSDGNIYEYYSKDVVGRTSNVCAMAYVYPQIYYTGADITPVPLIMPVELNFGATKDECGGCECTGTPEAESSRELDMTFPLGKAGNEGSQASLRLTSDVIIDAVYSPAALSLQSGNDLEIIYDFSTPKRYRQLIGDQFFVDLNIQGTKTYTLDYYPLTAKGTFNSVTGVYEILPGSQPERTVTVTDIDLPAGTTDTIEIQDAAGGKTNYLRYVHDSSGEAWTLEKGRIVSGVYEEYSQETTTSTLDVSTGLRVEVTEMFDATDTLINSSTSKFKDYSWDEEKVWERAGEDETAPATEWSYYDYPAPSPDTRTAIEKGRHQRLWYTKNANGSWEVLDYDDYGRLAQRIQGFGDADFNNGSPDPDECEVETMTYATSAPHKTTITKIQGIPVSRKYSVKIGYLHWKHIECSQPDTAWPLVESQHRVTIEEKHTSGVLMGKLKRTVSADGLVTLYTYDTTSAAPNMITTISRGVPNTAGTSIVSGTNTVQVVNEAGYLISNTTEDIETSTTVSSRTIIDTDEMNRPTSEMNDLTLRTGSTTYGCCGVEQETSEAGIIRQYLYDDQGQVEYEGSSQTGVWTRTLRDEAGRITETRRIPDIMDEGEYITLSRHEYNTAGEMVASYDAEDRETLYEEGVDVNGHSFSKITQADGATIIRTYYLDGRLMSMTGTAVHAKFYTYGAETVAGLGALTFATEYAGLDATATEWTRTYSDALGQAVLVKYSGGAEEQNFYNAKGQLTKSVDADGVTTLYTYNALGENEVVAVDVDRDDIVDFDGSDQIVQSVREYTVQGGVDVERVTTSTYAVENSDTPQIISTTDRALDDSQSWATQHGQMTHTETIYPSPPDGSWVTTTTRPDGTQWVETYTAGRLAEQEERGAGSPGDVLTSKTYFYDDHGRLSQVIDLRNGETTYTYHADDQLASVTSPDPDDAGPGAAQFTQYEYNDRAQLETTIRPDSTTSTTTYWPTGEIKTVRGSQGYPVDYSYTEQGRMETLTTSPGETNEAVTTWHYDPQQRWLTFKEYDDGKGTSYTYTPAGRLNTRTAARLIAGQPLVTTYTYDDAGALADAGGAPAIDYSDSTVDVSVTRNRLGQMTQVIDGAGTRAITFHANGLRDTESHTAGLAAAWSVSQSLDGFGRRGGMLLQEGSTVHADVDYTYSATTGRLATVSQGDLTATYGYEPQSALHKSTIFTGSGATTVLTATKTYDKMNRLTSITNSWPGGGGFAAGESQYLYDLDEIDQRRKVTLADGSYWVYDYDSKGQVIGGKKYFSDGRIMAGQQFEYEYDEIGNRVVTREGGDAAGMNLRELMWYTNTLNQYTSRTVPGAADVQGTVSNQANVLVNGQPAEIQAIPAPNGSKKYWRKQVPVNNDGGPVQEDIEIIAAIPGGGPGGADLVDQQMEQAVLPQDPESFDYDDDGNLLQDGLRTYVWDAENRLIAVEPLPAALWDGSQKAEYTYDSNSRRVRKQVWIWDSSTSTWTLMHDLRHIWDGWLLVAEIDALPTTPELARTWTWGTDLSGSFEEAGGIGGLLWCNEITGDFAGQTHTFAYDGNGNVTNNVATTGAEAGAVTAEYAYDPFGKLIRASGPYSEANPYRFSTKYQDGYQENGGSSYYGYRYYNSETGRWLSRDLIEEEGGMNLFGFIRNSPINAFDALGLEIYSSDADSFYDAAHAAGTSGLLRARQEFLDLRQRAQNENKGFQNIPREYGGRICRRCEVVGGEMVYKFYTTETKGVWNHELPKGASGEVDPALAPACEGNDLHVGWWHTHPAIYQEDRGNPRLTGFGAGTPEFSPRDKRFIDGHEGNDGKWHPHPYNPNYLPGTVTFAVGFDSEVTKTLIHPENYESRLRNIYLNY